MIKEFKPINFRSNSIFKALFTTIIVYVLQIFVLGAFASLIENGFISYILANLFLIIIFFILERKKFIESFKNIKSDGKGKIKNIIIVAVILIILEFIANTIIIKVTGSMAANTVNVLNNLRDDRSGIVTFIINSVFLLPILEAIIYFFPYGNIKKKKTAFILYTIIFALFHMISASTLYELLYIIPYLLLSFAITYSYYKTDNIYYPIMVHICNNIVAAINLLIILR